MSAGKESGEAKGLLVIGAGLARTGSSSLTEALHILGFGPCHNMGIYNVTQHFPYTRVWRWREALDMSKDKELQHKLLKAIYDKGRYRSAVDYMSALLVAELIEIYPNAKVIHTVRSSDLAWRRSVDSTAGMIVKNPVVRWSLEILPSRQVAKPLVKMITALTEKRYGGQLMDNDTKMYHAHNKYVREVVPAERLLYNFQATQGWGPLCEFLGVPVPLMANGNEMPYPHVQDAEVMKRTIYYRMYRAWIVWAIVLFGTYVLAARVLRSAKL